MEDPLEKEMAIHSNILPGKSHGQRNLVGYSPWDCRESDTTEQLSTHEFLPCSRHPSKHGGDSAVNKVDKALDFTEFEF